MNHLGFDRKCGLLAQEAHLAKNALLSGFDLLLKANFFQDKEGYFYSAFFHLSIGMERILKLAVVTHYMLSNSYKSPTVKQLRNQFGHDISTLYSECEKLMPIYRPTATIKPMIATDSAIIAFLTEYGIGSRYFNLNEVCEEKFDRSPLYKWLDLARDEYERNVAPHVRQRSAMNLMYRMDKTGRPNGFTNHLDETGNLMMVFDCLHRQYVIKRSSPLMIWRLIEVLRPIHFLLEGMSAKASEYEVAQGIKSMVIPHYEDFFYFLLARRADILRRKQWLQLFNG